MLRMLRRAALLGVMLAAVVLTSSAGAAVTREKLLYRAAAPAAPTLFFDRMGVQIAGSCGGGGETLITVRGFTDDAMLFVNGQGSGAGESAGAVGIPAFNSGSEINLLALLGLDGIFDAGQIIFSRRDGRHVTIDWAAHEDSIFPGAGQCGFWGIATLAAPGGKQSTRRRIDFRADASRKRKTVLDGGGLRLKTSCRGGNLGVVARTEVDHAVLHANSQGLEEHYAGAENLRRGQRFKLIKRLGVNAGDALDSGQLIYTNPKGSVVSVDFLARSNGAYGDRRDCAFVGTARVVGKRSPDRARFARKRPKPLELPAPRGVPSPEFSRFHERPTFGLKGACNRAEFYDDILFVDGELLQTGTFVGAEQSASGATVSGFSTLDGGAIRMVNNPDHGSGHTAFVTTDGSVLTVDWLAEEKNAFGRGKQRRKCLFGGTTEHVAG